MPLYQFPFLFFFGGGVKMISTMSLFAVFLVTVYLCFYVSKHFFPTYYLLIGASLEANCCCSNMPSCCFYFTFEN